MQRAAPGFPRVVSGRALDRARRTVQREYGADLLLPGLPRPFERDLIAADWKWVRRRLLQVDVENHAWRPARSVRVPSAGGGTRSFSELDPMDAIVLTSLLAPALHKRWRERSNANGTPVRRRSTPLQFWRRALRASARGGSVLIADISSFYNSIRPDDLVDRLRACRLEEHVINAVAGMMRGAGLESGIAYRPPVMHELAEIVLGPVDDAMQKHGRRFIRCGDDMAVFCESSKACEAARRDLASALGDAGFAINDAKVMIESGRSHAARSRRAVRAVMGRLMLRTMSRIPRREHRFGHHRVFEPGWLIAWLLKRSLAHGEANPARLQPQLTALTDLRGTAGLEAVITHAAESVSVAEPVGGYIVSVAHRCTGYCERLERALIDWLATPFVRTNAWLQIVIIDLLGRMSRLSHFDQLLDICEGFEPRPLRELILAAGRAGRIDWIRAAVGMEDGARDPWVRRAAIIAARSSPVAEVRSWTDGLDGSPNPLDELLARHTPAA